MLVKRLPDFGHAEAARGSLDRPHTKTILKPRALLLLVLMPQVGISENAQCQVRVKCL
jgi:hypothetical protein